MRLKFLRTLGRNLPTPIDSEADAVHTALLKDPPFVESQVREIDEGCCDYLIRHNLAEPTEDDLTELPTKAKPGKSAKSQKFAVGTHVEVIDKTLPTHKQTGEVTSAAPVGGVGDPWMYSCRRDDGSTFKASEGQLKKA